MPEELKQDDYRHGNGQQPQKNSFAKSILLPSFLCGKRDRKSQTSRRIVSNRQPSAPYL